MSLKKKSMFLFGKAIIYNIRDWLIYILKVGTKIVQERRKCQPKVEIHVLNIYIM